MKKSLVSFFETLIIGIFLALIIMLFVGQSLKISGDSMMPTLLDQEKIIVEKVSYKSSKPKRGDVVVIRSFKNEQVFLIKRVVGIPGDTLELSAKNEIIAKSVDGEKISSGTSESLGILEKYVTTSLPKDTYVIMGDNRDESYDSRMFGPVTQDKFVGKAFVVYWPLSKARRLNN